MSELVPPPGRPATSPRLGSPSRLSSVIVPDKAVGCAVRALARSSAGVSTGRSGDAALALEKDGRHGANAENADERDGGQGPTESEDEFVWSW